MPDIGSTRTRCSLGINRVGARPSFDSSSASDLGVQWRVGSTISSVIDCGIAGLRPRPERTFPSLDSAIRVLAPPSAESSSALAPLHLPAPGTP